jgi:hypothetical protein
MPFRAPQASNGHEEQNAETCSPGKGAKPASVVCKTNKERGAVWKAGVVGAAATTAATGGACCVLGSSLLLVAKHSLDVFVHFVHFAGGDRLLRAVKE